MGRLASLSAFALFLVACGDSGPSGPSSVPGAGSTKGLSATAAIVLTVASGETGEPVPGATVIVGGAAYETDLAGQVNVVERASPATLLDIVAPNFLDRQTIWRSATETRFTLWPRTSAATGLTEELTLRIVYTYPSPDAIPGAAPLLRLPLDTSSVLVVVSPEIDADLRAGRAVEDAVAVMNEALAGQISFQISSAIVGAVSFEVVIDPDAVASNYAGILRRRYQGLTITGCSCAFRTTADINDSRLLANSFGYCFGLNDSPDATDLMFSDWWSRSQTNFSLKEKLIMSLMLQRRAGNHFPDNDREARAVATAQAFRLRAIP